MFAPYGCDDGAEEVNDDDCSLGFDTHTRNCVKIVGIGVANSTKKMLSEVGSLNSQLSLGRIRQ